ncbi:hypothetical protein SYNPS1DRAFT_15480, partial [Syncephalis pseudoplumigaleata]
EEIVICGHQVEPVGVSIASSTISTVLKWESSQNTHYIQFFIGFTNYLLP